MYYNHWRSTNSVAITATESYLGHIILEYGRGRPLLIFSLLKSCPLPPAAFDAHVRTIGKINIRMSMSDIFQSYVFQCCAHVTETIGVWDLGCSHSFSCACSSFSVGLRLLSRARAPPPRPYIEGSDTRRFVYILRGLLCDVIRRLAPRAPLQPGRAPNDVTPYHRTTALPQQRVAEEVRWNPRSLLSWKFRG